MLELAIISNGFDGTVDLSGLGDGTEIVVSGEVSDVAGNASETFAKASFVIKDTVAPGMDSVTISTDDVINSSDILSAVAVSVSTTGVEDGQVVSLDIDGITADVAIASNAFNGTVNLSGLEDGTEIVVSGEVSDAAGNAAATFTKASFVIKDTVAPGMDSVTISTDDVINSSDILSAVAVSVSTTGVEDGQKVYLNIGGVTSDVSITSNGFDGTVDLSVLGDGTEIVVIGDVSDAAGNAAATFTKASFVIKDTVAPSIDSVTISTDDVINSSDTLSAVLISVGTTGVEDGQNVSLDIGGVTADVSITSNGFDGAVDLSVLGDGTDIVVSGEVSDAAGNAAATFTKASFVIKDTVAPSIDSVTISTDDVINSSDTLSAVLISVGTTGVEDGQNVSLDIGGVTADVSITNNGFDGTVDLSGLDDSVEIVVSGNVSDVAGNAAATFTKASFVIKDTVAPSIDSVTISTDDVINSSDTLSAVAVSVGTTGVEDGQNVSLNIDGVTADVSITSNGFDGTLDLSGLGEGTDIVVSGEVSDAAGNAAATFTKASFVIKDTVAPSIDSVTISTDDVINSSDTLSAVLISVGTTGVEDGQVVSLDVDGVTADVSITSNGFNGTVDLSGLGDSVEIVVSGNVSDVAGNAALQFADSIVVDTIAPSQAVTLSSIKLSADTGSSNTDFITNTAEQTISAELNASLSSGDVLYASVDDGANWVKIYTDANLSDSTSFSFSWTTSLPAEGNSSIQFQVADSADNNGSLTEQNYTLDITAPSLTVKLDSLSFDNDTGTADDDFITNTAEQTISAELNASLSSGDVLYASVDDGASWAKIYTDSNLSGSISFSWTTSLPAEGNSSIQFQVADSADNNGSLTEQNYTLDQTAPSQAVTLSSIKLSTDTGSSNTDFITNTAEQTISAELNASLSSGDVLYASVDDGASWAKIYTDSNLSGSISFSWTTSLPAEGNSSIQFQVADSADNNGSLTEQNYTLDQTAPSQAVTLSSIKLSTDTGSSNTDFITNTAEQSISAELNAILGTGDVLYASVDSGSTWQQVDSSNISGTSISWPATLLNDTNTIQFQVADSADNNGSLTEQNYTLDQTAPSQAITLSSIKLSNDTGSSNTDFITNTAEQTISAELNASLSSGDVLYASIDDGASWAKIYTDANLSDNTSFSWTTSLPAEGTSSIQFQVADSADNNGSLTEQNYTLDITAPALAVKLYSLSFDTDTGTADDDFITNTAEQTIRAKIYTDANLSDNTSFSWTTSLPAEGTSSIQFQVADSADNNGSLTEQNYTLDITAPALAVKLYSLSFDTDTGTADDDFITNTAEQTISAELNASLSSGDVLYASVDDGANWAKIYTDANLSGNTSFSWTTSLLEGASSIQFQVADSADNNGSLTEQNYTLDQTAPSLAVKLDSLSFDTDTGTADDDFITNTAEQTISAELNASLSSGDVLYASVDDGANWAKIYTDGNLSDSTSFSWTTSLPAEGTSSIQFQVADSADNNGSLTEQNYTLDQTEPSQAVKLGSIKLSADTGTADDDFITNTAAQSISAELNASLGSGDVLYASVDDGANWAKIYTDSNLSDNTSFSWTTSLPAEGTSSIQFQVADSADNNGSLTEQSYTLDQTEPSQAVTLSSIKLSADTGTADDDFITNIGEQSISAELNASLSSGDVLYASVDDGANWAKIYTDGNLSDNISFSWTTSLPTEGSSSIQFQVADSADNNGSLTEQNYTLDQTAPSQAVTLSSIKLSNDTGNSNTDFITNTAEQTISAELNAILGTGDVLYASVDDGSSWSKIYTDSNLSGNTSFSWTTSLPAEGTSSIQFQVADSADNNGSLSEQNYTLDITAPSLAVKLDSLSFDNDTGTADDDFITNTAEQTISAELNAILGTGDVLYASVDDGASWAKIYTDSNLSGSTSFSWTTSLPA